MGYLISVYLDDLEELQKKLGAMSKQEFLSLIGSGDLAASGSTPNGGAAATGPAKVRLEKHGTSTGWWREIAFGNDKGKDWWVSVAKGKIGQTAVPEKAYKPDEQTARKDFEAEIASSRQTGFMDVGGAAATPSAELDDSSVSISDLQRVIQGKQLNLEADAASEVIHALQAVCSKVCSRVGDLDHFNYDQNDFPELWRFQWGDGSTTHMTIPVSEDGIPAVSHWTCEDLARFQKEMAQLDETTLPAHVTAKILVGKNKWSTPAKELRRWISTAVEQNKGLFCFYS